MVSTYKTPTMRCDSLTSLLWGAIMLMCFNELQPCRACQATLCGWKHRANIRAVQHHHHRQADRGSKESKSGLPRCLFRIGRPVFRLVCAKLDPVCSVSASQASLLRVLFSSLPFANIEPRERRSSESAFWVGFRFFLVSFAESFLPES